MEPKQEMKLSIRRLLENVDRVGSIVRTTEHDLNSVCRSSPEQEKLLAMKERLGEIHARLDGIREFIISCERRAMRKVKEEDIDLWM